MSKDQARTEEENAGQTHHAGDDAGGAGAGAGSEAEASPGDAPESTETDTPADDDPQEVTPPEETPAEVDPDPTPDATPTKPTGVDEARLSATILAERRDSLISRLVELVRLIGPTAGNLLDLLQGINLGEIAGVIDAIADYSKIDLPIDSEAGVKARVLAAAEIVVQFVDITRTEWDDELVEQVVKLLENPGLLDLIASLVARMLRSGDPDAPVGYEAIQQQVGNLMHSGDDATYQAAAIPWSELVSIIQLIYSIVRALK